MASSFNLTAQINLRGPANLRPVVSNIKKQLSGINSNINIKLNSKVGSNIDSINKKLQVLNATLIQASKNGQTLAASLNSLGAAAKGLSSLSKVNANINKTTAGVTSTSKALKEASSEMENFGKQSFLAIKRFSALTVATVGIYGLFNAISKGLRSFIEFDKQLIRLQQITKAGAVEIASLSEEITRLSVSLGVNSESLAEVSVTLAQAGLTANQTKAALEALAKSELAPTFDNITDTTEGAIAAMRQFGLQASELEAALGSINAVAAAFAVESSDIIAAIQRAGGVFAASSRGVSEGTDALNEFIAVFTSVRATTRESAETIATGLRTIFTRIQRGSTIEFLKEFGVELTDIEGKFVGPYEAIRRLSEVLNTLDPRDLRFSKIVEELGGFRQISKVIPLIQQFSTAQEALKVAQGGQGSLTQAQIKAQQSLANQLARTRQEFEALIRSVGESQTFQALFKSIILTTRALIKLAGVFKPLLPFFAVLGAIKGASAIGKFGKGFLGLGKKNQSSNTSVGTGSTDTNSVANNTAQTDKLLVAISENSKSLDSLRLSIVDLQNSTVAIAATLPQLVKPITDLSISMANKKNNDSSSDLRDGGKVLGFNRGGVVPGSGRGDKVPAMLEPGEVVMSNQAAQKYGRGNLVRMNKYASGGIIDIKDNLVQSNIIPKKQSYTFEKDSGENFKIGSTKFSAGDKFNFDREDKDIDLSQYRNKRSPEYRKYQRTVAENKPRQRGIAFEEIVQKEEGAKFESSSSLDKYSRLDGLYNNSLAEIKSTSTRTSDSTIAKKIVAGALDAKSPADQKARDYLKSSKLTRNDDPINFGTVYVFQDTTNLDNISQKAGQEQRQLGVQKKQFGGIIQKFPNGSPGGVRKKGIDWSNLSKGRGKEGRTGPQDTFEPISTETYKKFAKDIYAEYDADPSLVKVKDELGMSLPAEIAYLNYLLGKYAFETGGAGMSSGKKFVRVPKERIVPELKPYLVPDPSRDGEYGFFADNVRPWVKTKVKAMSEKQIAALGKKGALEARESQLAAYTNAENAISEFKSSGILNIDPSIMSYIKQSIDNPDSLPLEPKKLDKFKKKLTKPNLDAFYDLTGPKSIPVEVQGQRTKLSEVFNTILDTYDSDASDLEIDNIISGIGSKIPNKSLGGLVQKFAEGGITGIYDSDKIAGSAKQSILGAILDSGKIYDVLHGPAGAGKTTMAQKMHGNNFVLSASDIDKYAEFLLLSGAGITKSGDFSPALMRILSGARNITALDPDIERLSNQRNKRLEDASLGNFNDTRSLKQLQSTINAPGSVASEVMKRFGSKVQILQAYEGGSVGGVSELIGGPFPRNFEPEDGKSWRQILQEILQRSSFVLDDKNNITVGDQVIPLRDALSPRKLTAKNFRQKVGEKSIPRLESVRTAILSEYDAGKAEVERRSDFTLTDEEKAAAQQIAIAGIRSDRKDLAPFYRKRDGVPLYVHSGIIKEQDYADVEELWRQYYQTQMDAANRIAGRRGQTATQISEDERKTLGIANAQGYDLEVLLAALGSTGGKRSSQDAIDFAQGLSPLAASVFGVPAGIPTQAKLTINSKSMLDAVSGIIRGLAFGGRAEGPGFEEVRQQIMDKHRKVEWRISKRKRGFGYNLMGALKSAGGLSGDTSINFQQPTNLKQLQEYSDKLADKLMNFEQLANGGFPSGGTVPAMVSNGEAYVPPKLAKRIGYAKLDKMNQADKNGMGKFASGGISTFKGPGSGTSDSIGPIGLPEGGYVIRAKATKALGLAGGGAVQKFSAGSPSGVRPKGDVLLAGVADAAPSVDKFALALDKMTGGVLYKLAASLQSLGLNLPKTETAFQQLDRQIGFLNSIVPTFGKSLENNNQANKRHLVGQLLMTDSLYAYMKDLIDSGASQKEVLKAARQHMAALDNDTVAIKEAASIRETLKNESKKNVDASKNDGSSSMPNDQADVTTSREWIKVIQQMAEAAETATSPTDFLQALAEISNNLRDAGKIDLAEQVDKLVVSGESGDKEAFINNLTSSESGRASLRKSDESEEEEGRLVFDKLAEVLQRNINAQELFANSAEAAGVSVQKFTKDIKAQIIDKTLSGVNSREQTRGSLKSEFFKARLIDFNNSDQVEKTETELRSSLSGLINDPDKIDDALSALMAGAKAGSVSLEETATISEGLREALDVTRDRSEALAAATSDLEDQLGGLTDAARATAEELDVAEFVKSGRAASEFGLFGKIAPKQALRFSQSDQGKKLIDLQNKFQNLGIDGLQDKLSQLPGPIGKFTKAIGGLPGVLAAGSVFLGDFVSSLDRIPSLSRSTTLAGVGGALSGAGQGALTLGTLGAQTGIPGAALLGTVVGALAGAIDGAVKSIEEKKLQNALNDLAVSVQAKAKAFENLSINDNVENRNEARKTNQATLSQVQELQELGGLSGLEITGKATVAAIIAGGLLTGLGILSSLTGVGAPVGLPIAATGAVLAGGSVAALNMYDPQYTELDNEAYAKSLEAAKQYVEGLAQLAEIRIQSVSLEQLNNNIEIYQEKLKEIDDMLSDGTITPQQAKQRRQGLNIAYGQANSLQIAEAQRSALLLNNLNIREDQSVQDFVDSDETGKAKVIADIAARDAAIQLARAEIQDMNISDAEKRKRERELGNDGLAQRGFELAGINQYQADVAQRLASITRQLALETEQLYEAYNRVFAGITRFKNSIEELIRISNQNVGFLTGDAQLGPVSRTNENMLRNMTGYSTDELNPIIDSVVQAAGNTPEAVTLGDNIRANKVIQEQLPEIFRNTEAGNIPEAISQLDAALKDVVSNSVREAVTGQVEDRLRARLGDGTENVGWGEILSDFEAFQQTIDMTNKAQEVGIAILEAQNDALDKVNEQTNKFASLLKKSGDYLRMADNIRLEGALTLQRALGRTLSLEQLNEPFQTEIRSLSGIDSTDPVLIAQSIRANNERRKQLEKDRQDALNRNDDQAAQNISAELGELANASNSAYEALEKLATSGTEASNILSKIEEEQRLGRNVIDFVRKVSTQSGADAIEMQRSFEAFNRTLDGSLNFGNVRERRLAYQGLDTILPLLRGSEVGRQAEADFTINMLEGQGIEVDKEFGNTGSTLRDLILAGTTGADANTQALIKKYDEAIDKQAEAARQLAYLNEEAAYLEVLPSIAIILNDLNQRLPEIIAKALASAEPGANRDPLEGVPAPISLEQAAEDGQALMRAKQEERMMVLERREREAQARENANRDQEAKQPANNQDPPVVQLNVGGIDWNAAFDEDAAAGPVRRDQNNMQQGPAANINFDILDRLSTVLPKIDTQMLNLIHRLDALNVTVLKLDTTVSLLHSELSGDTKFTQSVDSLKGSTQLFGEHVVLFDRSVGSFGGYVDKLNNAVNRLSDTTITMKGTYNVDVKVSGAAAFQAIEERTQELINTEISNEMGKLIDKIKKATGFELDLGR